MTVVEPFVQHEIEGYRVCRCGALVPVAQAQMQSNLCFDCFSVRTESLRLVEIVHMGRRACLPARPAKDRSGSRGSKRTSAVVGSAKRSAFRRLRALYPEMFDMLYDEERIRRGLPPVSRAGHVPHTETVETYDFSAVYAALTEPGDLDGDPSS